MVQTRRRPNRQGESFLHIPIQRMRMAPDDAVHWVLHFVAQDLGALSEARMDVLAEEALAFMGGHGDESLGPMARQTLAAWQAVARVGVAGYFTETGWPFDVALAGSAFGRQGSTGPLAIIEVPGGNKPEVFSWYALQAILRLGERFQRCQNPSCRTPFVAQGRQTYCSLQCGNRVRVAQFRQKQNKNAKVRAAYLARRKKAYKKRATKKVWARP